MTHFIVRSRLVALTAAALCVALVGGCSGKGKPTKANFEKVKTDMTEKEVEALMGPGKEGATADFGDLMKGFGGLGGMPGIPGVEIKMPKISVKVWEEGDTQFVVLFKDDKVASKNSGSKKEMEKGKKDPKSAESGDSDSKLTKANAEKIRTGMSKSAVEEILGPGKASADAGKAGAFVWTDGNKSISIIFVDDKVTSVQKINLK